MLVSGFPVRGYLSAATPLLVALCSCVLDYDFMLELQSLEALERGGWGKSE